MATGLEQSHSWPALRPWLLGWGLVGNPCSWQGQLFPGGGVKFHKPSFVLYFKNICYIQGVLYSAEKMQILVSNKCPCISLHSHLPPDASSFTQELCCISLVGTSSLGSTSFWSQNWDPRNNHTTNTTYEAIKTPAVLKLSHPTSWF